MAGRQEWQLGKAAAEEEHFQQYGWLWDDTYDEDDFDLGDSWAEEADQGDSWDYPDPLSGKAL